MNPEDATQARLGFEQKEAMRVVECGQAPEGGQAPTTLALEVVSEVHYVGSKGIIQGYASVFDECDYYNDFIRAGAFARSIQENFEGLTTPRIKVLMMHWWGCPIGLPTVMREDSRGLYVEARITDQTEEGQRARVLAELGLMDGLSIGFRPVPGGYRELGEDEFKADELKGSIWWWPGEYTDLDLHEFSLVTFPANWSSRVEAVKSLGQLIVPGWRPEKAPASQKAPPVDAAPTPPLAPTPPPAPEPRSVPATPPEADPITIESIERAFERAIQADQLRQAFERLRG